MARFTLPRDVYHGKGCLEELKNLKGKKAILVVGGGLLFSLSGFSTLQDILFHDKCLLVNKICSFPTSPLFEYCYFLNINIITLLIQKNNPEFVKIA